MADMEQLICESMQSLYEGGNWLNWLSSALLSMGMITNHGILQAFLQELLKWIVMDLLPQSNYLPCTMYDLKRMIM
jgi:hypothetical protein